MLWPGNFSRWKANFDDIDSSVRTMRVLFLLTEIKTAFFVTFSCFMVNLYEMYTCSNIDYIYGSTERVRIVMILAFAI